ncbi:MAG: 4Fe-4S binding protein [Actinobacteria bacterium]|nr:4Fe-4S binding protein [Actinomycetota bacterium]
MAFKITEECLNCGVCLDDCPSGAIVEGDDRYTINCDECTECGACAETCPAEAIIED